MRKRFLGILVVGSLFTIGCATVDVTKTAKGFFPSTSADNVEMLMTKADRDYIELATVSTTNWHPSETAKMYNAIRAKTAPLGAHAVLITDSGIIRAGGSHKMWTTGVAIRYKSESAAETAPAKQN